MTKHTDILHWEKCTSRPPTLYHTKLPTVRPHNDRPTPKHWQRHTSSVCFAFAAADRNARFHQANASISPQSHLSNPTQPRERINAAYRPSHNSSVQHRPTKPDDVSLQTFRVPRLQVVRWAGLTYMVIERAMGTLTPRSQAFATLCLRVHQSTNDGVRYAFCGGETRLCLLFVIA